MGEVQTLRKYVIQIEMELGTAQQRITIHHTERATE